MYRATTLLKTQRYEWKRRWEDCKSQVLGDFKEAVSVSSRHKRIGDYMNSQRFLAAFTRPAQVQIIQCANTYKGTWTQNPTTT